MTRPLFIRDDSPLPRLPEVRATIIDRDRFVREGVDMFLLQDEDGQRYQTPCDNVWIRHPGADVGDVVVMPVEPTP